MKSLFGLSMTTIMIVLLVAFAVCVAVVVSIYFRNRVMFRMGVRNLPRRGAQTALVVVGLMLSVEMAYRPPLWLHAALWLPLTVILALLLLPPIKGTLIGLQWALLMHGFDPQAEHEVIQSFDESVAAATAPHARP